MHAFMRVEAEIQHREAGGPRMQKKACARLVPLLWKWLLESRSPIAITEPVHMLELILKICFEVFALEFDISGKL